MTRRRGDAWIVTGLVMGLLMGGMTPVLAHHSFAMYDMAANKTMTGKLTRFIPGGNHAQLVFDVVGDDGQPLMKDGKKVVWGVETGSAAAIARNGITVESFPVGTILTVTLHPLRDGRPFGAVGGPIIHCGVTMPAGGCNEKTGKAFGAPAN
ncbi:MAG TPA: DUF6152 family protein [Vicinamibacterales bacterium]|nr:DUF6152 family protein [Vicinamibacterales bacterium]